MKNRTSLITFILALCLLGCATVTTSYPTYTPYPTYTSYPTREPIFLPSFTPRPTRTPIPTRTPYPIIEPTGEWQERLSERQGGSKEPSWSSGAMASPYHYAMIKAEGIYAYEALQAIAEYEAGEFATKGEWMPDNRNQLLHCVTCAGEWSIGIRYEIIDAYGHHEGEAWCWYLEYVFGPTSYPTKQDTFEMLGTLDASWCGYLRDR